MLNSDAACSLSRNTYDVVWYTGTALLNELFDRDWKEKASQQKKPERAFESYTRPTRKNLH